MLGPLEAIGPDFPPIRFRYAMAAVAAKTGALAITPGDAKRKAVIRK